MAVVAAGPVVGVRRFHVVALQVPIVFNADGDHDHNGLVFALEQNRPELEDLRQEMADDPDSVWYRRPHPLVRPLVLRARAGETVEIHFDNHVSARWVGIHLVADGYDVHDSDGADVGANPSSLTAPAGNRTYTWRDVHEGVFPFHDAGDLSGGQDGTNVHGLFGALVVEPARATWTDPVTGDRLDDVDANGWATGDGLYVDVHPQGLDAGPTVPQTPFDQRPPKYPTDLASFREYAVFFHDEAEYVPAHGVLEPNPCPAHGGGHGGGGCGGGGCGGCGHCGGHDHHHGDLHHPGDHHAHRHHGSRGPCGCSGSRPHDAGDCRRVDHGGRGPGRDPGGHGHGGSEHEGEPPIMTISYRAEPMINRERRLWRMIREGSLVAPVIGEEQHHSSWLFGEPATPVLCAYVGDPMCIRFVHAAVKETHVFHQHVYQWHADPGNRNSPIVDSVTVGPQTGHTIRFLFGAGSEQGAVGDAIFHCHLYPHFHEGMWGITRAFDRRQTGHELHDTTAPKTYPDGSPLPALQPLPDRQPPPDPTDAKPGFPFFIPGQVGQKSPIPPWPAELGEPLRAEHDYRPPDLVTQRERDALNSAPEPGALFNLFPFGLDPLGQLRPVEPRAIDVISAPLVYNSDGWHDPHGHLFVLADDADEALQGGEQRPLVVRGHRDTVVETTLHNRLPATFPGTAFDLPFPPCDFFPTPLAECGLHVHLVKFDPLVSDGASVGWNYLTGPRTGKKMVYRWYVDEEFGTVFFHDHLFANHRQKHGLFGAFIAEVPGARFLDPDDPTQEILAGVEAVIEIPQDSGEPTYFREFCVAVADFVPQFDGHGDPLNPPEQAGGHSDQGVMAVNYRSEPIIERGGDPAFWFLSRHHRYEVSDPPWAPRRRTADVHHGDPDTDVFRMHAGDPARIRLLQGSHEEQHSFQVHGMRWRQYAQDAPLPGTIRPDENAPLSPWRNQQTIGISEAFTFGVDQRYGPGDHLWRFSAADDTWLGCWGLVRVLERGDGALPALPLPDAECTAAETAAALPPEPPEQDTWRYHVVAEQRPVVYRERDLIDPYGVVYRLTAWAPPGQAAMTALPPPASGGPYDPYLPVEPLVIRCSAGDWVRLTLENRLPLDMEPEPFAPRVPVEDCDRPVSSRISVHADLLRYDVRTSDGANVGHNPVQSAEPGAPAVPVTYSWYADEDVGVVLLQDVADFRNHRHHGAVGALVVEPAGADADTWCGPRATVTDSAGRVLFEEIVLILQDGLRLFTHGNESFPVPDVPDLQDDPGGDTPDVEDQGQKGFNYRSEPTGRPWWLDVDPPATPLFTVPAGSPVRFRLVGGADKPRNHSFTIHGHTWVADHISEAGRRVGAVSGVTSGWVGTFSFDAAALAPGAAAADHAYRSGVLKWDVVQGLWGIMRVQ